MALTTTLGPTGVRPSAPLLAPYNTTQGDPTIEFILGPESALASGWSPPYSVVWRVIYYAETSTIQVTNMTTFEGYSVVYEAPDLLQVSAAWYQDNQVAVAFRFADRVELHMLGLNDEGPSTIQMFDFPLSDSSIVNIKLRPTSLPNLQAPVLITYNGNQVDVYTVTFYWRADAIIGYASVSDATFDYAGINQNGDLQMILTEIQ